MQGDLWDRWYDGSHETGSEGHMVGSGNHRHYEQEVTLLLYWVLVHALMLQM